ncbi:MAG: MFS transporter [Myxococcales bacterium]|nr:MFS transporter [Myxococcales bacterium]MCB9531345.1 MFS transporter [Myxococcales bacterium]
MNDASRQTGIKLGLLGSLYFSQGLPFGFFTQALPVMLRTSGFSLGAIGLTSLLATPWALKFLWAPAVDRYAFARFGRRKSWIVPLQLAAVVVLAALAGSGASESMPWLMGAVFVLNLIAATQDIATDGLAVDMLEPRERGFANGIQVAGYRVGMIVGGGVLLILHDRLGSAVTFLSMAILTALATIPVLLASEPKEPEVVRHAYTNGGGVHFLLRPGAPRILALLVVYKAGDAFATSMLRPYLADVGLTLEDIGWLLGTVGFVSGLVGAVVGGALVNRLGRRGSLVLFGAAQAATVAGYAFLATQTPSSAALYVLCAAEHLASGMATAALFTCMMDWCASGSTATDYTVQASAVVIATGVAGSLAGFSAQAFGYLGHFAIATVLAFIAVVAARALFPTLGSAEEAFNVDV